jgi:S-ribosylhomocysteine lyase LuxS involved in autoinducer biosynthesis
MFESESIELIKDNFNVFFDRMIRDLAEDDSIKLVEFRYRQKVIEVMRDNMNETLEHLVFMIMRRNLEKGKNELGE